MPCGSEPEFPGRRQASQTGCKYPYLPLSRNSSGVVIRDSMATGSHTNDFSVLVTPLCSKVKAQSMMIQD